MARPNKGANYLGPFLGVVYEPEKHTTKVAKEDTHPDEPFQKYWFSEFTLGIGGKTLLEDWLQTQFNTPQGHPDYRRELFAFYGAYSKCKFCKPILLERLIRMSVFLCHLRYVFLWFIYDTKEYDLLL